MMWYGNVPTTSSITISIGIIVLMANFLLVPFLFYEIRTIWEDFDVGMIEVQELRLRVLDELMKITNTSDTYLRTRRSSTYKVLVDRNSRNGSTKRRRHRKRRYELPSVEYYSSRPRRFELNYPYVFRLRRTKEPSCMCILHNTCPPGPPGEKGLDGVPGEPGVDGADGKQGITEFTWGSDSTFGLSTELCMSCPPGPPGEKGPMGPRGRRGLIGASGEPGIPGSPGTPGLSGVQGHAGENGEDGNMGDFGNPGSDAEQVVFLPGPRGEHGSPGKTGYRGEPGKPNYDAGIPGTPGADGRPGKRGKQGRRGRIGYQGAAGHKRCPCPDKTIDIKDVTYYADPKFQVFPSIIFKEEPMDMNMLPEQNQSEGGEFEGTLESMSSDASPETLSPEFVNNLLGIKNRLIEIRRSPQKDEKRFKRNKDESDPLVLVVGNGVLTVQKTPKLPYKQTGIVDLKKLKRKEKIIHTKSSKEKSKQSGLKKQNRMKLKLRNNHLKRVGAIEKKDRLIPLQRPPIRLRHRVHGVKHRKPNTQGMGKKQILSYSKNAKNKSDRAIKNKVKSKKRVDIAIKKPISNSTNSAIKLQRKEISLKKNRHSTWVERRSLLNNSSEPSSEYAKNLKSIHRMLEDHLHPDPLYKIETEIQANKEEVTGRDGKKVLLQEIANEVLKRLEKEETKDLPKATVVAKHADKSIGGGVIPMNNQLSLSTGKRVDVEKNEVNN